MNKQEPNIERDLLIFRSILATCIISGISIIVIVIIDTPYNTSQYPLLFNQLTTIFFISLFWCMVQVT